MFVANVAETPFPVWVLQSVAILILVEHQVSVTVPVSSFDRFHREFLADLDLHVL